MNHNDAPTGDRAVSDFDLDGVDLSSDDDLETSDLETSDLERSDLDEAVDHESPSDRFVDLWDMEFLDEESQEEPRRRASDADTATVDLPDASGFDHEADSDHDPESAGIAATSGSATAPSNRSRSSNKRFWQRTGGVAPMITPPGRFARFRAARRWSRKGFVPMTPRTQKLRHRILPRTVIGISTMFMAAGIGAAFSGAAFYAYYDDRLAENEAEVARFVDGFDQQFTTATGTLDQLRLDSIEEIRDELDPLGDYVSDRNGVVDLPAAAGSAIWSVETIDEEGKPVIGSAFAVTGHEGGTALVTSLSIVRSATLEPSPSITIVKGPIRNEATLWSWDEEHDLALIIVEEELSTLNLAGTSAQLGSVGSRVFAMSGTGSQGATASPGVLLDQSAFGVQHTAVTGDLFVGGPIIDSEGLVVGVVTADYVPLGVDPGAVALMPDVPSICARVLRCPSSDELVIGEIIVGDLPGQDADG